METIDSFPRQRDDVAARVIDGEAVVVTPADSKVHELDEVATFIWERCDGQKPARNLVAALVAAFDVTVQDATTDLLQLLETFVALGLVDLRPAAAAPGTPEST